MREDEKYNIVQFCFHFALYLFIPQECAAASVTHGCKHNPVPSARSATHYATQRKLVRNAKKKLWKNRITITLGDERGWFGNGDIWDMS